MWIPQGKWRHVQKPRRHSPVMRWRLKHWSVPPCLQVLTWRPRQRVSWYQSDADSDVHSEVSVGRGRDRKETEVRSCHGVRTDVLHSHYWMFAFWNASNSSLWKGVSSHCSFLCHSALCLYIYIIWGGDFCLFFVFVCLFVRVCIWLLGEGVVKGLFQIDLIHSLGKGSFPCVGISKIISL